MGYLEKGFEGKTEWWRYLLTLLITFIGVALFSIPHSTAIAKKTALGAVDVSKIHDVSYLMTLFDSNTNLIYMMLPFIGGLLFLFLGVKYIHKQSITNLTTFRKKIDWKRVSFSFSVWGFFMILFIAFQFVYKPESLQFNFNLKPFLILCAIGILFVPIQTSFEEYLFRGYLMQSLGLLSRNKWFPLVFTSVVFGVMHLSNPEITKLGYGLLAYYIGTGFFLGIISLMDEGIELALGFHAANNLISALLVTADWQVFQTYSIFKDVSEPNLLLAIVPSLLLFPVMIFIYSKKYHWSHWKNKLTDAVLKPIPKNSDATI